MTVFLLVKYDYFSHNARRVMRFEYASLNDAITIYVSDVRTRTSITVINELVDHVIHRDYDAVCTISCTQRALHFLTRK